MNNGLDEEICKRCRHFVDSAPEFFFGNEEIRVCPKTEGYIYKYGPIERVCRDFEEKDQ